MTKAWCIVEIQDTFSLQIDNTIYNIQNNIRQLRNRKISGSIIKKMVAEGEALLDLSAKHDQIIQYIDGVVGGSPSHWFVQATDNRQVMRNFYKIEVRNWSAYYHIDERFCIIISVLLRHTSHAPLFSLHEVLLDLTESFRETP